MGALSHLRVLDLTRILAGPWGTQTLADLGAEVIKIERPKTGDDTRQWGPPDITDPDGRPLDAAYFHATNRGKKSVALDINTPEDQETVRRLAAQCDVLVENFKAGGLKRYGLDYESIKQVKPDIVYCSITGFGQDGPYAKRPGYDVPLQAMGGMMSLTGEPDGEPMKTGVALTDIITGLYASTAILAALAHRDRTGEGQWIDLSLLDVNVAILANQAMNYLVTGNVPKRHGNAHPSIVPYQVFAARDGYMAIGAGNDSQFARFAEALGRPELASDPKYATNGQRVTNREELIDLISAIVATRTIDEWVEILEPLSIPFGPVNTLDRVFDNPQVQHRHMLRQLPHPVAGTVPGVASPIHMSATPVTYDHASPMLGAHTDEILNWLDEQEKNS